MLRSIAYTKLEGESKTRFMELLCHAYDVENANKRLESLIWTSEKNPHADYEDYRYYVIRDGNNITAYNMRMPVKLFCKNKIIYAYFHHETLVHPEYRRKGLGIEVSKNGISDSHGLCMSLWANEKNLSLLFKIGFTYIGNLKAFKKIIKIDNIMKDNVKSYYLSSILTFFGRRYLKYRRKKRFKSLCCTRVFEITRFTDDMRDSLDNINKKFNIITYRDVDYLNWKYIDIPYREYKVYGVSKNGNFMGYVVLRVEKDIQRNLAKGIIVDVLCDPEEMDCFFSLILKAEKYFIKNDSDFIVCLLTFDKFSDWMRELKFSRRGVKGKSHFLLTNIDQIADEKLVKDFKNWYITYGDSDYDMLIGELKVEAR